MFTTMNHSEAVSVGNKTPVPAAKVTPNIEVKYQIKIQKYV
jgi:hypothetical protein